MAGDVARDPLVRPRLHGTTSTGGRYVDLAGVDQLVSDLAYVAKTVTREFHFSLWQIRYLWVGLLLLLGLEWGIRRIAGLI